MGLEEEGRGKGDSRGSAGGEPSVEVEPAGGAGLGEDRCLSWMRAKRCPSRGGRSGEIYGEGLGRPDRLESSTHT